MELCRQSFRFFAILISMSIFAPSFANAGEAPIDVKSPPQGRFIDEWAEVYIAGKKTGYSHSSFTRKGDQIRTESTMFVQMGRVDQPVKIEIVQHTLETIDGKPIGFGSTMNMSTVEMKTKGVIEEGKVNIVSSQMGFETKISHDFPADAMMTWGLFRESMLRGFDPGTTYDLKAYAPEIKQDGAVVASTTVGKWETFSVGGTKKEGHRVNVSMDTLMGSIETTSWLGKSGLPMKAEVPAPGLGNLVVLSTDQRTALADFLPPELFMTTVVPVKRHIDRKAAKRIRYRLTAKAGSPPLKEMLTTSSQKVKKLADGSQEITVSRLSHRTKGKHTPTLADRDEYLHSNMLINLDDPELIKLAKKAGGGVTEPFALGDKLRRFVTEYIVSKNLNIGFATASEVCRTREGDCSEHGILLAALGRLNGLPSRVAVGLAYVPIFGNQEDIFGYHMWTQFYMDGRWIDFDAALRESDCSPTRITFATSSLKNTGLADLSLPLLSLIGGVEMKILEVEELPMSDK